MKPSEIDSELGNGVEQTATSAAFLHEYLDTLARDNRYPILQPVWIFKSPFIDQSRQNLIENFSAATANRNRQSELMQSMQDFEARARRQGLSEREVAESYAKVGEMLGAKQSRLPVGQRASIAQQFIRQAADPSTIHQVDATCTIAALENRIMTRHPSVAADLLAQAVTAGQFKGKDGKVIAVDDSLLFSRTGQDEQGAVIDGYSIRSQASAIFFRMWHLLMQRSIKGGVLNFTMANRSQNTEIFGPTKTHQRKNSSACIRTSFLMKASGWSARKIRISSQTNESTWRAEMSLLFTSQATSE